MKKLFLFIFCVILWRQPFPGAEWKVVAVYDTLENCQRAKAQSVDKLIDICVSAPQ